MCRNDVHLIQKAARIAFCDSNSIVTPHLRRKTVTIRQKLEQRPDDLSQPRQAIGIGTSKIEARQWRELRSVRAA